MRKNIIRLQKGEWKMSRNAVIMAAGMSTRFVPLSKEIPKALVCVKGEVIIERQIRQLREAGVEEIVIVVGYLGEKFKYLKEKYNVIIVENPVYKTRNNHSSLYVAREYLGNTFICSGDNYFTENVFIEESDVAYYASTYEAGNTKEWCMTTEESGKIIDVQIGGKDAWIMKGHVYFTEDFSKKLIPFLVEAYENDCMKNKFWEEVYMDHIDKMEMHIKKYSAGILEEFDSIEELREFDETYINHSGSQILGKICMQLNCKEREITKIQPVKTEDEVVGFTFEMNHNFYEFIFDTGRLIAQTI